MAKTRPPSAALLDRLKATVGPAGFLEEESDLAPYLTDWRGLYRGHTPLVLRPGELYATAALAGAVVDLVLCRLGAPTWSGVLFGIATVVLLRLLTVYHGWSLAAIHVSDRPPQEEGSTPGR